MHLAHARTDTQRESMEQRPYRWNWNISTLPYLVRRCRISKLFSPPCQWCNPCPSPVIVWDSSLDSHNESVAGLLLLAAAKLANLLLLSVALVHKKYPLTLHISLHQPLRLSSISTSFFLYLLFSSYRFSPFLLALGFHVGLIFHLNGCDLNYDSQNCLGRPTWVGARPAHHFD